MTLDRHAAILHELRARCFAWALRLNLQWRASPHCMVVNLVRSGRKQPKLFFAGAGVQARHLLRSAAYVCRAVLAALALSAGGAIAADGVSLVAGAGDDAYMSEVAWFRTLYSPVPSAEEWKLSSNVELNFGYWHGYKHPESRDIAEIGATPVFRISPPGVASRVFIEAGIGIHFLSTTSINSQRAFGSSFQFGDLLGVGWSLGKRSEYEVGVRVEHFSNAGIAQPNNGITFWTLRLAYRLIGKGEL